jgi:hypothetical protein
MAGILEKSANVAKFSQCWQSSANVDEVQPMLVENWSMLVEVLPKLVDKFELQKLVRFQMEFSHFDR